MHVRLFDEITQHKYVLEISADTILERLGENHDDVAILKLTLPGNIISYPSLPSRGYHGAGRGLVY